MSRPKDHTYGCHDDGLCLAFCFCWCHLGPSGVPTLPPEPIDRHLVQDKVRFPKPSGKHVSIALKVNGELIAQHTFSVEAPIEIDPGPLSIKTTDRLTIEARIER